jgi:hypothetical protein
MKGGLPPEAVTLLPYREGLGLGGCLFLTFSAPEKVKHRYDIKEKNLFERESEIENPVVRRCLYKKSLCQGLVCKTLK